MQKIDSSVGMLLGWYSACLVHGDMDSVLSSV